MENLQAMQRYIDALRAENNNIHDYAHDQAMKLIWKEKQMRILIGSTIIVLTFLGVWIKSLYYANGLLAADNQTKENWRNSAIILTGKYNDSQFDLTYCRQGMEEAITKGFIQKMPPPMIDFVNVKEK